METRVPSPSAPSCHSTSIPRVTPRMWRVAHLVTSRIDPHLGRPPGGPVQRTERPVGAHLHHAAVGHASPASERSGSGAGSPASVPRPARPRTPDRDRGGHPKRIHRPQACSDVVQLATRRNPGLRSTRAVIPACRSNSASSLRVNPRRTEVSPSRFVAGSKPKQPRADPESGQCPGGSPQVGDDHSDPCDSVCRLTELNHRWAGR